jgi:hypothetical protein
VNTAQELSEQYTQEADEYRNKYTGYYDNYFLDWSVSSAKKAAEQQTEVSKWQSYAEDDQQNYTEKTNAYNKSRALFSNKYVKLKSNVELTIEGDL